MRIEKDNSSASEPGESTTDHVRGWTGERRFGFATLVL